MDSLYPTLTVIQGTNQSAELVLDHSPIIVGRGGDCDITLQDHYASRYHCWIEQQNDATWWVRDLGSKNGTLLNGQHVEGMAELSDGATISIGRSQLRFTDPLDPQTKTYQLLTTQQAPRLNIDLTRRMVEIDGVLLDPPLSRKQWLLLSLLSAHRGEAVAKAKIADAVWPEARGAIFDYQIDKLVSRLRTRLGDPGDQIIETIWGVGYRLL